MHIMLVTDAAIYAARYVGMSAFAGVLFSLTAVAFPAYRHAGDAYARATPDPECQPDSTKPGAKMYW